MIHCCQCSPMTDQQRAIYYHQRLAYQQGIGSLGFGFGTSLALAIPALMPGQTEIIKREARAEAYILNHPKPKWWRMWR